jgi:dipeptidyl aminopeptidase/acylaminoacyl peptidase
MLAPMLCIVGAGPLAAQAAQFNALTVAPDGRHVAWIGPRPGPALDTAAPPVLVLLDRGASGTGTAESVVHAPGASAGSIRDLAWSADGSRLAFVASSEAAGEPLLYIVAAAGGTARLVAHVPGGIGVPRFAPDGSRIALLYTAPSEESNGPLDASPRDTGAIDDHVDRQHLVVVDGSSGAMRQLTPRDLYVYEYDWAPDGRALVASAATGSGNNNWWTARLYAVPADSGALREIAAPSTQVEQPSWSPDGSEIAFIGGLMSDQNVTGGDVYVVAAAGGTPRDVTPGTHVSVSSIAWIRGTHEIIAAAWAHGGSEIARIDTRAGTVRSLWSGDELISAFPANAGPGVAASADGAIIAAVRETITSPPEIWVGPIGHWIQVTHANTGVRPTWGTAASVSWKSDGFDVQGWLLFPRDFDPARRYPMVVDVHGGPAYAWPPAFGSTSSVESALSASGYFVFLPNPRGSYGQGEAFARANVRDFGYGDLRDIQAGIDAVLHQYPVDSLRLGITGWSYGGYMTMWAVTQTTRFRAAVSGAGLSNWLSYTGENGISEWMVPYFGATAYEDPAVYARSAPITFIDRVRTPTLLVVGERDVECPAPQSYEFWRGLQHAGATTQLVVYPDEGHGFTQPAHQRDVVDRTIRWFDRYLKAAPPAS